MKIKKIMSLFMILITTSVVLPVDVTKASGATSDVVNQDEFVNVDGTTFSVDGKSFYFAGTNNYYLPYAPDYMVDDVFQDAEDMGLKVMRTWGFSDAQVSCGFCLQPSLGQYDEKSYEKFDYVVKKAKESGIKLVIPFVNYWADFGGMDQYVSWTGAGSRENFYTNEKCKEAYKNYINHFLNRTNSITGVKYKDDPTIMAWELGNEPRCKSDTSGDTLYNWTKEMSEYIKSLDENHMVAIGDEGFFKRNSSDYHYAGGEGVDWDRLVSLPSVDYGTYHLYPDAWGGKTVEWGTQWIKDHIEAAKSVNKPAVLEEFGITNNKESAYKAWGDAVVENDGAGFMFWTLTGVGFDGKELYPDYDNTRVLYPSTVASVLVDTAKQLDDKNTILVKLGDVNNDGKISGIDFIYLKKYLSNKVSDIKLNNADINGDGKINVLDLVKLKEMI